MKSAMSAFPPPRYKVGFRRNYERVLLSREMATSSTPRDDYNS